MLSPIAADHVNSLRNVGPLDSATHVGRIGIAGDGPHMTLWFELVEGRIKRAAWSTHGCPSSIACASMAAQILTGRTLEQALSLTSRDLDLLLGGLPDGKGACADMAIAAVQAGLGGNPS